MTIEKFNKLIEIAKKLTWDRLNIDVVALFPSGKDLGIVLRGKIDSCPVDLRFEEVGGTNPVHIFCTTTQYTPNSPGSSQTCASDTFPELREVYRQAKQDLKTEAEEFLTRVGPFWS